MAELKVNRLMDAARLPTRMTAGSAGFDIYSAVSMIVPPAQVNKEGLVEIGRALISTGLALEIPAGMVGRIGSRSGLSVKHNLEVGAGWIDSDYRGELKIELKNLSCRPFAIAAGDRIAQLILLKLGDVDLKEVDSLASSSRGAGGFGSTGGQ
jgi:dUTP pyrophosphatase